MRALQWAGNAAALLLLVASGAAHTTVTFANGWMRPVAATTATADVYVDVRSTTAQQLVAARSPWARSVELVAGGMVDGQYVAAPAPHGFALAAGEELRFARYGNVLRFTGLTRNAFLGDPVTVTLTFRDARGRTQQATAPIRVRGLFNPPPAGAVLTPPAPAR
jgi:copper(I)-binding protein